MLMTTPPIVSPILKSRLGLKGWALWQMIQAFDPKTRPTFSVVDPMKYFPDQFHLVKENLKVHDIDPNEAVNHIFKIHYLIYFSLACKICE